MQTQMQVWMHPKLVILKIIVVFIPSVVEIANDTTRRITNDYVVYAFWVSA